ncbi:MAG: hypothetical protein JNK05_00680 [Myxococcales bacterium]|nr:hypothetical protein [Myxococcales bacterium]
MRFRSRWPLALAAGGAFCVMAPARVAVAQQAPRVALGPVTGPNNEQLADKLNSILELHGGEVQAIPGSTYFGVASRLGVVGRVGEEDLRSVARELRLDAIIVADLSRMGRGFALRIRVARGRDGSIIGTVNLEIGRVDDLDAIEQQLWGELVPHFRSTVPAGRTNPRTNPTPSGTNGSGTSNGASGTDGSGNGSTEPTGATDPANGVTVRTLPGLGVVQLALNTGWSSRSWRMPVLGERSPRGYENGGFFEGGLAAHVFYRLQRERLGIGAHAYGTLPLVISSRGTSTEGTVVSLQTSAFDVGGGASVAYLPPGGGAFRSDVGFVFHAFDVNTARLAPAQQLVRMSYIGARARAEGAVPLIANGSIELAMLFAGELRMVSVGAEARMAYGENAGLSWGFGGTGGMELRIDGAVAGLAIRATGSWLRYRTTFSGRADVGTGSDSVDDYMRVHLGVSYAFGVHGAPARAPSRPAEPETRSEPEPPPPRPTPPPRPQGPPPDPFS